MIPKKDAAVSKTPAFHGRMQMVESHIDEPFSLDMTVRLTWLYFRCVSQFFDSHDDAALLRLKDALVDNFPYDAFREHVRHTLAVSHNPPYVSHEDERIYDLRRSVIVMPHMKPPLTNPVGIGVLWKMLIAMNAGYPEFPSVGQQQAKRELLDSIVATHPCEVFKRLVGQRLADAPPPFAAGLQFTAWLKETRELIDAEMSEPVSHYWCDHV